MELFYPKCCRYIYSYQILIKKRKIKITWNEDSVSFKSWHLSNWPKIILFHIFIFLFAEYRNWYFQYIFKISVFNRNLIKMDFVTHHANMRIYIFLFWYVLYVLYMMLYHKIHLNRFFSTTNKNIYKCLYGFFLENVQTFF